MLAALSMRFLDYLPVQSRLTAPCPPLYRGEHLVPLAVTLPKDCSPGGTDQVDRNPISTVTRLI